jgi:hypothetical protein
VRCLAALIVGIGLVSVGGYLYLASPPVDVSLADQKLAVLPLLALPVGVESTRPVQIPNSKEWNLLVHEWGAPEFVIGIVSALNAEGFTCFREANVVIRLADSAGHDVSISEKQTTPYGYVSECASGEVAFTFAAAPGSELILHVTAQGPASSVAGDLIVRPYWLHEKDRIVGSLLKSDLRTIARVTQVAGLVCLLICVWCYHRLLRKRGTG